MEKKSVITLPLLATKNYAVLPIKGDDKLDVGRSFSINAVNAAKEENNSLLLVLMQKDPAVENPTPKDLFDVGTLARIVSIGNGPGQSTRVRLQGLDRVVVEDIYYDKEKDIYIANGYIHTDSDETTKVQADIIKKILDMASKLPRLTSVLPHSLFIELSSNKLTTAQFCDKITPYLFTTELKRQEILSELDINKRLDLVFNIVNEMKLETEVNQAIEKKVAKNVEKNQKDYILHEKLKAIREELGDGDDSNTPETILDKIEKNTYPEHVKNKIKADLKRYEMMPQSSLESSLSMAYIQTLLDVPWYQKTEDNDDLKNVQKILDEDHFGLTKVKERIVEYLAVKKMTGNLKAPIICFYGPPGCGKTSLGKSIARALGRKFFKASLGGISDEAEIRGHRRTYVGSMPGRIISGMKRVGVNNPVFLLDEIDKLASSYKGDPASALLEVLDPEQNFAFNDNYLEEPYDLSNVLFICTANYLDNIPAPLRDRLELIEVNSYTEFEKIQIAKNFLFKKQLTANGLKASQVSISDESFKFIIEKYTMEAGVRELERKIASIMRKVVVEILTTKEKHKIVVTPKLVEKYLGVPLFENTKKEKTEQVGVVTGLAYTQYGGDILPIEVNYFPGKGGLVLTGKLGDVMKESATIALDYVKANAKKYKIDSKLFSENDIHVHVPEGAVPKDGPSAGVAITTAIISSLTNQPVDNNVAMTGEVTLRGRALPIGGLREKSLAALRSGVKTIIVPSENKKAVDELPKEVKDGLSILYMKNVDDAVKVALKHD